MGIEILKEKMNRKNRINLGNKNDLKLKQKKMSY